MRIPSDFLPDLALLAGLIALGALVARAALGFRNPWRISSLAFPFGTGVVTWLVFLASWMGGRIQLAFVWLLLVAGLAACMWMIWRERRRDPGHSGTDVIASPSAAKPWRIAGVVLFVVALLWIAWNIYISVARSYSLWDAISIWSIKGYGIAQEGSVFAGAEWGAHGLSYPLHLPLLIALFSLAGGDPLPGSKVLFPLYFASLVAGVYEFGRSHGMRREIAGLAALFVAGVPILFTESTSGYANAPMTVYLVLAALALVRGAQRSSMAEFVAGGLLLGWAGWTRVEGILYSGAVLLGSLVVMSLYRQRLRGLLWSAAIMLAILAPWWVFYRIYGAGSSQAAGALSAAVESFLRGQFHLGSLRIVLEKAASSLLDVAVWGGAWLLPLVLAAFGYRYASRAQRAGFLVATMMAAGAAAVTVLLFYVGSFGTPDLRGWLDRGFNRALLPSPILLTVGALYFLMSAGEETPLAIASRPVKP